MEVRVALFNKWSHGLINIKLHLTEGFVGSLEINLQKVAKQGQRLRSWRLLQFILGDDAFGEKTNDKQKKNRRTGEEEEATFFSKRHFVL